MTVIRNDERFHPARDLARRLVGSRVATADERREFAGLVALVPELEPYRYKGFAHVKDVAAHRGFETIGEYRAAVECDADEMAFLRENLTLNGSHFFRGSRGWETLIGKCLPMLAGRDGVRAWCAGCSSGEEVYSLVLALVDVMPAERISVLATDYSSEMLERCRDASYAAGRLEEIPKRYRHLLVPTDGGRRFTLSDELLSTVRVKPLNLLEDEYPHGFDIILCRNVIKFFTAEARADVQGRLAESLAPEGCLFLATDSFGGLVERIPLPGRLGLRRIGLDNVYQRMP